MERLLIILIGVVMQRIIASLHLDGKLLQLLIFLTMDMMNTLKDGVAIHSLLLWCRVDWQL